MRDFKKKIRQRDEIAPKAINLFHYYNDFRQKTTLGGVLTIFVKFYMWALVLLNLKKLLFRDNPTISSINN